VSREVALRLTPTQPGLPGRVTNLQRQGGLLASASREVFPTLPKQAPGFSWMKEIFFVFEINVVEIQFELNHCQPTCERFLGAN